MPNPEAPHAVVFAIAGLTSTGKTRLGEGIVGELRERNYRACVFSVGDIFRLLTIHTEVLEDSRALSEAVQETLSHTHVHLEESGRVRLHYNGESVRQTYHNGNNAAVLTNNGAIIHQVDEFIRTHLAGSTEFDFVGLDGRERRNADILIRTTAPDPVRVAIRRVDQPEACIPLTDDEILHDIQVRDVHEASLVHALQLDDINVLDITRLIATPDADKNLAIRASGVLVDFQQKRMPSNFGTIHIQM